MCGIAGVLNTALDGAVTGGAELVRAMCDQIVHRGPDDDGYLVDGPVAMGMRRLSIIDVGRREPADLQ